jgi:hypothetical protein
MLSRFSSRRHFDDLSEQEVLALAISNEEDDARIYRTFAQRLRDAFPASAAVFDGMAAEEDTHRQRLIEAHRSRFGEVIPLLRREHVSDITPGAPSGWTRTSASTASAVWPGRWRRRRAASTWPPPSGAPTRAPATSLGRLPRPRRGTSNGPAGSKPST